MSEPGSTFPANGNYLFETRGSRSGQHEKLYLFIVDNSVRLDKCAPVKPPPPLPQPTPHPYPPPSPLVSLLSLGWTAGSALDCGSPQRAPLVKPNFLPFDTSQAPSPESSLSYNISQTLLNKSHGAAFLFLKTATHSF